ncbi:hypothetical protein AgCh_034044 [Apium graveolens]
MRFLDEAVEGSNLDSTETCISTGFLTGAQEHTINTNFWAVSIAKDGLQRFKLLFSTPAAAEEPITPPVAINYTKLLINGQFVDSASGKTFPTLDPRTGEVIADIAEGDAEDINRAVSAARKAFDEGPWPRMAPYERSQIMLRFADLVGRHNDDIAALETWDNGKPYEQAAKAEIPMLVRLFRYYAGKVARNGLLPNFSLACLLCPLSVMGPKQVPVGALNSWTLVCGLEP